MWLSCASSCALPARIGVRHGTSSPKLLLQLRRWIIIQRERAAAKISLYEKVTLSDPMREKCTFQQGKISITSIFAADPFFLSMPCICWTSRLSLIPYADSTVLPLGPIILSCSYFSTSPPHCFRATCREHQTARRIVLSFMGFPSAAFPARDTTIRISFLVIRVPG